MFTMDLKYSWISTYIALGLSKSYSVSNAYIWAYLLTPTLVGLVLEVHCRPMVDFIILCILKSHLTLDQLITLVTIVSY